MSPTWSFYAAAAAAAAVPAVSRQTTSLLPVPTGGPLGQRSADGKSDGAVTVVAEDGKRKR